MTNSQASSYAFGDSDLAAERLRRLAAAFDPASQDYLERLRPLGPRSIADLGCGPGYTTRLLASTFAAAEVKGLDSSTHFIDIARQTHDPRVCYEVADVTVGLPGGPYDLIYARYLLTHIADAQATVLRWGASLSAEGVIVIEENEWIETDRPAIQQYLAIVQAMLSAGGQKLYIGAELAALPDWTPLRRLASELVPVRIDERTAAGLFVPNVQTWRHHEFIRRNYVGTTIDRLEGDLQRLADVANPVAHVVFGRRRLTLAR